MVMREAPHIYFFRGVAAGHMMYKSIVFLVDALFGFCLHPDKRNVAQ